MFFSLSSGIQSIHILEEVKGIDFLSQSVSILGEGGNALSDMSLRGQYIVQLSPTLKGNYSLSVSMQNEENAWVPIGSDLSAGFAVRAGPVSAPHSMQRASRTLTAGQRHSVVIEPHDAYFNPVNEVEGGTERFFVFFSLSLSLSLCVCVSVFYATE